MDNDRKFATWVCATCGQRFRWPLDRPDPDRCPTRHCKRLDPFGANTRVRRA